MRPWMLALLVPIAYVALFIWSREPVSTACSLARLPHPPGKIVHKDNLVGLFAGTSAFVFTAPRKDIERWLSQCKDRIRPEGILYTPKHYLVTKTSGEIEKLDNTGIAFHRISIDGGGVQPCGAGYEVAHYQEGFPWFRPHITHGVRYSIPWDSDADYGAIFVDWDTNTVWVTGSHS